MSQVLASKSVAGAKFVARPAAPSRSASVVCRAEQSSRRELMGLGALVALTALAPAAKAGITDDLLAKSAANKALNDKKRLATVNANFARSRTVTDGTCRFPNNLFGCEPAAHKLSGSVKYIADDFNLECEGKDKGECASRIYQGFSLSQEGKGKL